MPATPEFFDLTGHVAVITEAGRGIGEGIARSFAEAGAAVVVAAPPHRRDRASCE